MSYLKRHGTRRVPQSAPIRCSGQVPNSAGGFAWAVDDWTRLRRFLVLGSEGGSYYASEWTLTRENAKAVEQAASREDGPRAVAEIVRVAREGRAPKNDPALFALALAAGLGDEATRQAALEALPQVAPHGHAPVPVRDVRRGLPRLGPLAAARGRPLVRRAAGRTRSPTRRSSTASARA